MKNTLFTEAELWTMTLDDLDKLWEASWALLNAHKNWYQKAGLWTSATIHVDNLLTAQWAELLTTIVTREQELSRAWRCVVVCAQEQQADNEADISRAWRCVAILAKLNDFAKLDAHELWLMKDYVKCEIYSHSDNRYEDLFAFDSEYNDPDNLALKVAVCQRWARTDWSFGWPDFTRRVVRQQAD